MDVASSMTVRSKRGKPVAKTKQAERRVPKRRNQNDPLEIWLAYQPVRDQKDEVKALAKRFNLHRRRIQQIGNGERPASKAPSEAHRPPEREQSRVEMNQAHQERASFLAVLDTALTELQGMARRLSRDLEANQPPQPDLLGHTPALDPFQVQIANLRKLIKKEINANKTTR